MRCAQTPEGGEDLAAPTLHADSWTLPPEVKDTAFKFGETRIVLHYDSMTNRSYPRYELRVYSGNELLATHEHVGFEQVFPDPLNTCFLGVSNRGLIKQPPGPAGSVVKT